MRRAFAAITAVVLLGALAGVASAGGAKPTEVSVTGVGGSCIEDTCTINVQSRVESPAKKCVGGRTVVFYAVYDDGPKQKIDTDKSTDHGYAGGYGRVKGIDYTSITAKVKPSKVGNVKCAGVKESFN